VASAKKKPPATTLRRRRKHKPSWHADSMCREVRQEAPAQNMRDPFPAPGRGRVRLGAAGGLTATQQESWPVCSLCNGVREETACTIQPIAEGNTNDHGMRARCTVESARKPPARIMYKMPRVNGMQKRTLPDHTDPYCTLAVRKLITEGKFPFDMHMHNMCPFLPPQHIQPTLFLLTIQIRVES